MDADAGDAKQPRFRVLFVQWSKPVFATTEAVAAA